MFMQMRSKHRDAGPPPPPHVCSAKCVDACRDADVFEKRLGFGMLFTAIGVIVLLIYLASYHAR